MALKFENLLDRQEEVPRVIGWWHSKWADRMGPDIASLETQLRLTLKRNGLPLHLLAIQSGNPIGTATLKRHEMLDVFPELHYWLGSVFVAPEYRGNGVASSLATQIIRVAREQHIPQLYLQTEDLTGGLYAALGWEPVDRLVYKNTDTLLMVKHLG